MDVEKNEMYTVTTLITQEVEFQVGAESEMHAARLVVREQVWDFSNLPKLQSICFKRVVKVNGKLT